MRRAVAALLAAVAAIQLFLTIRYYGFLTGDDVEVLEEAFRRAIGMPYRPWDIRNLFVPDFVVAPVVWLANAIGIHDRRFLIASASLPFIALSLVSIVLVFRLAARWSNNENAAFAAACLFALHWLPLGFGSTVYPRTLATACVLGAVLIVESQPIVAGALIGIAFTDRYSEVVFLAPLMLIARDRLRVLAGAAGTIAITVGVYDWITWGTPFASLMKFAQLTLVAPDFASRVKYHSTFWYLANVLRWCAPTLLILIGCGAGLRPAYSKGRRDAGTTPFIFIVIPLIVLSVIRHKEFRYLQGVIPFLAIAGGAGFAILWERRHRLIAASLLVLSLAWNLYGIREFQRQTMPAVMAAKAIDRDPRIRNVAVPQAWALGGSLYFHRPVELHEVGTPPERLPAVIGIVDAVVLYRSEVDAGRQELLRANGFVLRETFRDGKARVVVLFTRPASGT